MTENQIWKYTFDRKVDLTHPFDRDLIWIHKKDFKKIAKYFSSEFNLLHQKGKSYRTFSFLRHIHAVEKEDYMFMHFDFGNPSRFLPLALIHFFIDVLPFFAFCLVKRKSPQYFFIPPK